MKKWISLLLVLTIALSFAACGKETKSRRPASPVYNTNIPEANAAQPNAAQPDPAQPDAAQSEAVQPDTAQPEAVQADDSAPDASQADVSAPDASQPDVSQPNASGNVSEEKSPAQNSSADKETHTGTVSLVNPISVYLAESGLAQELIFPGSADGAIVQNGELHFNPHGEDAAAWFEQIEMATAIVSDDGTTEGTAQTGITYTINGYPITVTCTAASDDDWYLVIG